MTLALSVPHLSDIVGLDQPLIISPNQRCTPHLRVAFAYYPRRGSTPFRNMPLLKT